MQDLTIAQGLLPTAIAFFLALIGCGLGLLGITLAADRGGVERVGWIAVASFGLGADGICAPQLAILTGFNYFGSNSLVSSGAIALCFAVAIAASAVAMTATVAMRGRVLGRVVGGVAVGIGAVCAHAIVLTGMVNPPLTLSPIPLLVSVVVASVIAALALSIRTRGTSLRTGIAATVAFAASTVVAERIDIQAVGVQSSYLTTQAASAQSLGGVPVSQLLVPLLIVTCLAAIGLFFAGIQAGSNELAAPPAS